eukprot:jgi/Hompol1/3771/HPOL_006733-RA
MMMIVQYHQNNPQQPLLGDQEPIDSQPEFVPPFVITNDETNDDDDTHGDGKAQEKLKTLVQRTAEKLIDISSIRMLDRLQHSYAAERADEYIKILDANSQTTIVSQINKLVPHMAVPSQVQMSSGGSYGRTNLLQKLSGTHTFSGASPEQRESDQDRMRDKLKR